MANGERSLTERGALTTCASSGIGAATPQVLAEEGASVALAARQTDRLQDVADRIEADCSTAVTVPTDISYPVGYDGQDREAGGGDGRLRHQRRRDAVGAGRKERPERSPTDARRGPVRPLVEDTTFMEPADVAVSIVHAVRQPAQAGLNEPVIRPSD